MKTIPPRTRPWLDVRLGMLAGLASLCFLPAAFSAEKPNVLLILVDDFSEPIKEESCP